MTTRLLYNSISVTFLRLRLRLLLAEEKAALWISLHYLFRSIRKGFC